jgi:hypothetical protein
MKKIIAIVFLLSFISGNAIFAGNDEEPGNPPITTAISGKVFDKNTMEELAGVTVQIEGTDIKAYTDIEGNFSIDGVKPGKYNITVTYISYKETELSGVNIDAVDSNDLEIKLEQID